MKEDLKINFSGRILIEGPSFLKVTHLSGYNKLNIFTQKKSENLDQVAVMCSLPIFPDRKNDSYSKVIWKVCRFESFWANFSIEVTDSKYQEILKQSCSSFLTNLRYYLILKNLGKDNEAIRIGNELKIDPDTSIQDLIEFTHNF